jgi:glyoxylase-like metal-dependent hydrolase (beta-lactamase superfamily II)/8-oxo-dGTP pyrophosphatase MutT (NUDIX family)
MDRFAAAIALYRGSGTDLEVFLVHRSPELRVFGDYFAMPGGVRSPMDGPDEDVGTTVGVGRAVKRADGRAMQQCAIRELFEETGVLLDAGMRLVPARRRAELRRGLLDRDEAVAERAWRELQRVSAGPAELVELCRIRTPAFTPVRYDTQFFLAALPDGEEPDVWPGELTTGRFATAESWLTEWASGDCLIAPPVVVLLQYLRAGDLSRFAAEAAAMTEGLRRGKLHRVFFSPGILMATLNTPTLPPATTTNCFIVGTDRLFIVDPGAPEALDQAPLFELLDELRHEGARLEAIIVTHHHPDHVGGVNAVSQRYQLPVHAHGITMERLQPGFLRGRVLADGDRIDLGTAPDGSPDWCLEVIFTPGHARGHLAFRDSRYRALIAGDMISTVATIMIDPPEGHLATYMNSLHRLLATEMATLLPAHGPAVPDGKKIVETFIRHRELRQGNLRAAVAEGPRTLAELLPNVYGDVNEALYPYATRALMAGLEHLEELGEVVESDGVWTATDLLSD